jgi:CheY-like chemotaxis protein
MTKTILLADDSVTIQKVIELTFMDEDYEVASAGDGEEALERLEEVTPDVVIADVHMPGASGFDVAKRSKQLHPNTPVLLLVGTFEPFDEADYEASGADSYLKKPFDSQELLQRVGALLESAGAATGAPTAEAAAAPPAPEPFARPTESLLPPLGEDEEELAAEEPWEEEAPEATPWGAGTARVTPPEDLAGTRAVPGLARDEAVQPAPAAPQAAAGEPEGEPFPELGSPGTAAPHRGDEEIFTGLGFGEGDGSTEVAPPPDLLGEDDEWAPRAPEVPPATEPERAAPAPPEDAGSFAAAEVEPSGVPEAAAAASAAAGLSDADVDRIARRVVELMGDGVLREVAWEVVPDLAEVVIKDRLRELESQVAD